MHVYVFWRASSVPFIKRYISRPLLIGIALGLWAIFLIARIYAHGSTRTLSGILELLGMNWMAVLFLLFVPLILIDLITVFGFLLPRLSQRLRGWAIVVGFALSIIAIIQGMRPPVIQSYAVRIPNISSEIEGTVLVVMSDLHLGSLLGKRWLTGRAAQVQAQRPDIVVLLGDIFEGHGEPLDDLLAIMRHLSAPLGVWAVLGNHEFHGDRETITYLNRKTNIQLLRDQWVELRPGLVIAGVDDLTRARRARHSGDSVSKALEGRPPGITILFSHTPWQTEKAASAGTDLMLCGHTHGGQIWPFGYLVRLRYPLLAGRYEVNGMTVIVCRGTGTWGPRMRLWHPGEILRITLHGE